MAALAVIGASDTISVVIRQTMVQLRTPDAMRGRVFAVNSMVTISSNQLGVFRAGTAAAVFGTIPSVLIGGLSTLAVVLISTKISPRTVRRRPLQQFWAVTPAMRASNRTP